jgi:hypothetical protein
MLKTLMMTETHRRIKGTTHHAHFRVTSADISGVKVDADVPAALVSVTGHPGANAGVKVDADVPTTPHLFHFWLARIRFKRHYARLS